ncbi:hypothetical protein OAN307_c00990 [Octadecabacter antarcticus 307]|uniref:Uncharacterized protein n=1 Tax=Octadecabacter antarcticus 307 TaxID=391626 RepID=M9R0U8_9RHOB|nr:hypothetical protein [Octadecabacter antarcticus]AGI65872.1 hypothetical protein OAN307_c00990 [Octadecabacter antarcticus 307]
MACHNDGGIAARIAEECDYDLERADAGGTEHVDPIFFEARGLLYAELLEGISTPGFLNTYWVRIIIPWLYRKRFEKLKRIESRLVKYA